MTECQSETRDLIPSFEIFLIPYVYCYLEATIIFIIFWDSLMFCQIFLSPQVKRCTIITYKHSLYDLPHELTNNLRLRNLGNEEILQKCLNFTQWKASAQFPRKIQNFVNTSKKLPKNSNQTFPAVCYPTPKPEPVPNTTWPTAIKKAAPTLLTLL